jgi:hypothetical protein
MFKHAMEFLKQRASLKKPLLEQYFISFMKDSSNKDVITLFELLATSIRNKKYISIQLWVGGHGSHNTNKTKSFNSL